MTDRLVKHLELTTGPDTVVCTIGVEDALAVQAVDLDAIPVDTVISETSPTWLVIIARTVTDLRRAVTMHAMLPKATRVTVAVAHLPQLRHAPLAPASEHPDWRNLLDWRVHRTPGHAWVIEGRFSGPAHSGEVLLSAARAFGGQRFETLPQPVVALAGPAAAHWRPGDPNATLSPVAGPVPERSAARGADLALRTTGPNGGDEWADPAVSVVTRPEPASVEWARIGAPGGHRIGAAVDLSTPLSLPPVDERSVNPVGFVSRAELGTVRLAQDNGRWAVLAEDGALVRFAGSGCVTDADLARLRRVRDVRVDWRRAHTGPVSAARVITGLAAGGVPMTGERVPTWGQGLLGPELVRLLESTVDFDDPIEREAHSVRLRRTALEEHGTRARWRQFAAGAGVPVPKPPTVSVLLTTNRPDMVEFGLAQIARQRDVDVEVILNLHGIPAPDVAGFPFPLTVVQADPAATLGTILNEAAARASGSFLAKMDDDDWYGPRHLADLHLTHLYTGCDLTGSPAEFIYLKQIDTTVQRYWHTETWQPFVAGGTIFLPRSVLHEVGGFRPLGLTEDGQLLEAVRRAGGRIYQAHGLNYLLRREPSARHTWREPINTFLNDRTARQWRGFRPNPLMELDGTP
ncbi:glycosyltransferase family 2 protein [Acrocarpospora sp. B8E8]|uniref:glycosyltransferase n=1 Tax=Acrocarpospora sp. B8E8 TaxID=3153572 RepID=UPI00325D6832